MTNAHARLVVPLLATLAGCASGAAAPRAGEAPAPAAAAAERGAGPARASTPAAPARRELSPRAQRLFDQAVAVEAEQRRLKVPTDWEALERAWRQVVDAEPVPEAWFNLGVALEHRGRKDEARSAYRRALELEPRLAPAATNLALLDEPADPQQAAAAWTELGRRFPDDPVPHTRLAALYQAAGQQDEAWRQAREALVRDPRAIGAYKVMMRVALERGSTELAELLAVKARKLDDADPELIAFVGDIRARQRDRLAAVAQWRKAVAARDDYLPARYALLDDAVSHQQWEGVTEQARAILRTSPDARVQLALGVAQRHLGHPDEALAAYAEAERLGGARLPEVHLARGVALMKGKDQCEPAVAELERYTAAAGPGAAAEGPAPRLERECREIVAANRQAEEAARQMKQEAERAASAAKSPVETAGSAPATAAPVPDAAPAGDAPQPGERTAAPAAAQGPTR